MMNLDKFFCGYNLLLYLIREDFGWIQFKIITLGIDEQIMSYQKFLIIQLAFVLN